MPADEMEYDLTQLTRPPDGGRATPPPSGRVSPTLPRLADAREFGQGQSLLSLREQRLQRARAGKASALNERPAGDDRPCRSSHGTFEDLATMGAADSSLDPLTIALHQASILGVNVLPPPTGATKLAGGTPCAAHVAERVARAQADRHSASRPSRRRNSRDGLAGAPAAAAASPAVMRAQQEWIMASMARMSSFEDEAEAPKSVRPTRGSVREAVSEAEREATREPVGRGAPPGASAVQPSRAVMSQRGSSTRLSRFSLFGGGRASQQQEEVRRSKEEESRHSEAADGDSPPTDAPQTPTIAGLSARLSGMREVKVMLPQQIWLLQTLRDAVSRRSSGSSAASTPISSPVTTPRPPTASTPPHSPNPPPNTPSKFALDGGEAPREAPRADPDPLEANVAPVGIQQPVEQERHTSEWAVLQMTLRTVEDTPQAVEAEPRSCEESEAVDGLPTSLPMIPDEKPLSETQELREERMPERQAPEMEAVQTPEEQNPEGQVSSEGQLPAVTKIASHEAARERLEGPAMEAPREERQQAIGFDFASNPFLSGDQKARTRWSKA